MTIQRKDMSPTEEMYRSKTNAELKELLEVFELGTPKAKNPFKPNKDEMVQALMQYKRKQDSINGIAPEEGDEYFDEDESDDEMEVSAEMRAPKMNSKQVKAQKAALLKADLMRMERVIVHDTQTMQTPVPTATITWGNRALGIHNDVVHFGKPWYLRRGALQNLRDAVITEYTQDREAGGSMRTETRNRYLITETEGWTDEELQKYAMDQKIRNSRAY